MQVDCLDEDIKNYLIKMYGDKANDVLNCVETVERLHKDYAHTNAELIYTIKEEFVQKPMDYIVRRTSLALIDKQAAKEILNKVLAIMQKELSWDEKRVNIEKENSLELLNNSL